MPGPRGPMGGGRTVEKPANFGNVMGKLVHYCRNYLPVIIIALVLGAAGTICQIIGPDKLKDMTNEIVKGLPAIVNGKPVMNSVDFNAVGRIAWLLVALYVGYAVLSYVQSWMMANVTQRTAQRLRESISVKINKLPLKYFDKVSYGDVLSRITNDVDAIGQTLGQSLGSLITSATLFVGALVMMFYNNVIMTLCAIGASILGLIIMMVIMKSSQKYFARQQMALGDVNGHIEEMYAGHLIVKAYNGEADSIRRFEKYNADLYESGWKSQFLSGLMMPLMNFVGNFGYVIVCVVGAALAMDGKIEFGVIVAFMMYIRLFTQPLSQFAQAFQNLQRCAAAAERVFGFLEEPEMDAEPTKAELGVADAAASTARTDSGKLAHRGTRANATAGMTASQRSQLLGYDAAGNPRTVRGDVEFSHVRFGYEPDKPIIHDSGDQPFFLQSGKHCGDAAGAGLQRTGELRRRHGAAQCELVQNEWLAMRTARELLLHLGTVAPHAGVQFAERLPLKTHFAPLSDSTIAALPRSAEYRQYIPAAYTSCKHL